MNSDGLRADGESEIARRMQAIIDETSSSGSAITSDADGFVECLKLVRELWSEEGTQEVHDGHAGGLSDQDGGRHSDGVLPRRLGRFEVRRILGHGGFGIVLLAFDETLDRDIALKIPRPELLLVEEMRARFVREAKAAAVLDHPRIVPVFETGEVGAVCYIAAGYVKGPSLAQWLKESPQCLSHSVAARLVVELADAVQHAHSRGILHRDLKPSNVLLEPCERTFEEFQFAPKLTDFGLAKQIEGEEQHTLSGVQIGTPRYMAPEQAANRYKEIGVATDVYGLGAILHELLTGEPPFVGESNGEVLKRIQEEDLSPARLRSRRVPRDLETICLKCLEKEPTRRYQSARDLADDLCRFLDGRPVLARPIRLPARLARWSQRRPVVAGLASALIVAVAAGTTTALWQWYRAEQYLVEARAAAASAQRNLEQSQHALFDLAWIVEESNARRDPDDRIPNPFHKKLEEYRAAGWLQPTAPLAVKPLLAVSHSFAAHDAAAAGNTQAAINHYNQALEYWCQVTAAKWSHERGGYDRGFALCLLSAARHRCRLDAESDDPLRGARELITQVSRDYRVTPFSYIGFVSTAKELAYLHMEDRRWREAVEHFELARLALEVLIAWVPHDRARFEHWMASLCREIASMHRKLGNGEAVAEHLNRAIAAAQQSLLVKPDELLYEHELALDLRALGSFYRERRNLPAAQETLEQGVSTMTGVFERHRESPAYAIDLAKVTRELALVLQARGRRKEALAAFVRSREAWTEASSRADPSVADRQMHAKVCHQAGTLALELDQPDLARRAFADGVAAYSKLTMSTLKHNEQFEHAECHYFLARHSESVGDKPAAIEHYERAVELLKDQASKRDANLAIKDRYRRSVAALEELRKAQPAGQPVSGGP